ncbi:MAG: response regulator [Comamonadaceae bacterium]|nr:MAG: response regulator [Comamonadaceae bacterium]
MSPGRPSQKYADIFIGDSEMAGLMREHDWTATTLGPPEHWPTALKVALQLLLSSKFEMWLGWGPDVNFFYNDAYRPTLGIKHPASLAQPTHKLWAEIWDDVKGRVETVYQRGESTWDNALLLLLERSGYPEETYHTFSYSPLMGDTGKVEGLFCAVSEDTGRVISQRRLGALRDLASGLATAESAHAVWNAVEDALGRADRDMPFAMFYLFDESGGARLARAVGVPEGHPLRRGLIAPGDTISWGMDAILNGAGEVVTDLAPTHDGAASMLSSPPMGAWPKPPAQSLTVPLLAQGGNRPIGFMVTGLNPYKRLADDFVDFMRLLAGQVSASLANAEAFEARAAELDRMHALFQQAPSFMCVLRGPEHIFELVNESYTKLIGHRDVLGKRLADALPEVMAQGFGELLDKVYASGEPYVGLGAGVALQRERGAVPEERFVNFLYQPITGDNGEVTGIFVDGSDVTAQVAAQSDLRALNETLEARIGERTRELAEALDKLKAESAQRESVQDALRQAQKMEAVGQLTGGIAHDFNNLLQGITGSLDLLKLRVQLGKLENIDKLIAGAMNSAQRAAGLTHRLLAFSRRQPLDPRPVKVGQLASSMDDLLRRTLGEKIQLEVVIGGGLWQTLCDPNQLEAAILNLAINARDAMPHGGTLTIEAANAHLDHSYASQVQDLQAGQYVCISVTDSGEGMSAEVLARAVEPFFTTKPIGQGTGLGLSMVYGFARQSQGHLRLYSEVGHGTSAKLYLPRHAGVTAAPDVEPDGGEISRDGEGRVVLVVEDEPVVRALVVEVLAGLGYQALEAADGVVALKLLQTSRRVDLLLTDVGLPRMNGRQLADAARIDRPALKILFMTGYAENAALANGFLEPGMEMITKPFPVDKLAGRIRQMLEN